MVTVLPGADSGRYPHGNSVLVCGGTERVLIDPSLSLAEGDLAEVAPVDRILLSHSHEDHLAALFRFPGVPVHVHSRDRIGLDSIDGLMQIYGMAIEVERPWRHEVLQRFHYVPRPDAQAYEGGDVFDLGGGVKIHVIHLPGHTRGHSGFFVEPDGVMFLADVDLTGFGPYYGDAWSSIDEFETSIRRCREIDARKYVTFHHKGTIYDRAEVLRLLAEYQTVIERRETAILQFLSIPRSVDDLVAHRFVYRSHVKLLFADAVERRSAELHLERLMARRLVTEVVPGMYRRSP